MNIKYSNIQYSKNFFATISCKIAMECILDLSQSNYASKTKWKNILNSTEVIFCR